MKLNGPVKGIFLDIGWTLIAPLGEHWLLPAALVARVGRERLGQVPQARFDAVMDRLIQYLDDNHLIVTEQEEETQFRTFFRMLADALPELGLTRADVEAAAHDKVYNMENYRFYEDSVAMVKQLQTQYKLGILSDNWPSCERLLKRAGIWDCFSTVTVSSYLGVFKSHPFDSQPNMFADALEKMGLPAEQTVFVDDGPENLEAAARWGIQPVLITRTSELKRLYQGQTKYAQISSLAELSDILP